MQVRDDGYTKASIQVPGKRDILTTTISEALNNKVEDLFSGGSMGLEVDEKALTKINAMDKKSILQSTPPNLLGQAQVAFRQDDFDALIYTHGYNAIFEKAVRCPCGHEGSAQADCNNCNGSGFFYINPTQTRVLLTGINSNTTYKEWSLENIGTISITTMQTDNSLMSYYDRVTIKGELNSFNESCAVRHTSEPFIFTAYKAATLEALYVFEGPKKKLRKLSKTEYHVSELNPYVILFDIDMTVYKMVSCVYTHELQYFIIDFPHDVRSSLIKTKKGNFEKLSLPKSAIARRLHLSNFLQSPNFDGTGIINND